MPSPQLKLVADVAAETAASAEVVALHANRHTTFTRVVHWACASLIFLGLATVLAREFVEDSAMRGALLIAHRQFGTLGLLGLTVRLTNRFTGGLRHVRHNLPFLMQLAATLTHLALYVMLLAVPVLGWAASNAHNVQVSLLGIPLPQIAPADSDLSDQLDLYHSVAAWTLLATAAAHIGAALFHHFVKHDTVLASMLPARKR